MKPRLALAILLVSGVALLGGRANGSLQAPRPEPGVQQQPTVTFNGAHYLVAWTDSRTRISGALSAATPLRPQPPPPPPPPPRASLYGARVTTRGEALDEGGIAISTSAANESSLPASASDGLESLVVWTDRRNGVGIVYGARVTRGGGVFDPAGITISAVPGADVYGAAAAFDGGNYFVAWHGSDSSESHIYATFVSDSGTVLRSTPIRVTNGSRWGGYPHVAFDGTNYLVVWSEASPFGTFSSVYAARVSRQGDVLDPEGILVAEYAAGPDVAFNGTNYLVVWGEGAIYGKRVSPSGQVLDSAPITITSRLVYAAPTVGSDGTNYLVAWEDPRFGCCSIFGTRVSGSGSVLDPDGFAIATHGREQRRPAIAFDGTNYFVVWQDNRAIDTDIYGARVTPGGRLLDPRGILLSTAPVPPPPPPAVRCIVPRVVGLRLNLAQRHIRRRHCSIGSVRRKASSAPGKVLGQRPRAGAIRPVGSPVSLLVGRR